jgi:hypothetical protein
VRSDSRSTVEIWLPDSQIGAEDPFGKARKARSVALEVARYYAQWHRLVRIGLLGDMIEAFAFSRWKPRTLAEAEQRGYIGTEIEPCQEWMDDLQETCKNMVYIEGNHENRFEQWALSKMDTGPISDVIRTMAPSALLSRTRKGKARRTFTWVPYGRRDSYFDIAPNLRACHSMSKRSGLSMTIDNMAEWTPMSVIHGHGHHYAMLVEPSKIGRKPRYGISPGCLCDDAPNWMLGRQTKWTQSLAIIFRSSKDPLDWTPYAPVIFDGRVVLPDGHIIQVK